jgi:hypothetical protein
MPDQNSVQVIAASVSAAATVIYTVGTFMLWHLTRRTLQLTSDQVGPLALRLV